MTTASPNATFTIGQAVRYKPGFGTYGYEDAIRQSPDGRLSAVVIGFSKTRVRVRIVADLGRIVTRCVDAQSLSAVTKGVLNADH